MVKKTQKSASKKTSDKVEWGARLAHALALYSNATVTGRISDTVELRVPVVVGSGRNTETCVTTVTFGAEDFGLVPKNYAARMSDEELGKRLFMSLLDIVVRNGLNQKGKPLSDYKKLKLKNLYGDTFLWERSSGRITESARK